MAFCSKCGTELTEGAKFCPKCGNPTGSSETKEMVGGDSSNCSLELVSAGFAKLQVVKALREIFGIGLKEAKDMVDSTPLEIAKNLTLTEAKKIASFLSTAGAKSIVKQNGKTIFIEEPSQNINPQTEEQGGNKLMKYGAYVFGALCFLYILGTCVGGSSDGQEETQIEQKEESPKHKKYREERGSCIEAARCYGESVAKESANDLIRQGYAKSDLKGIAAQQARLEYKTVGDCCNPQYFEENYKEYFTKSDQQKLVEQCREAYVIGYMNALGKTYNY